MRAIIAVTILIILSTFTTAADAHARRHVAHQTAAPACARSDDLMRPCLVADLGAPFKIRMERREPRRAIRGARAVRMAVRAEPALETHWWQDAGTEPRQIERTAKAGAVIGGRPPGCPHAYCGCGASIEAFGRIVPGLNLAANWLRRFPRAAPAPEMAAARPGHVFILKQHIAGNVWMVHDSNSGGHRTRMHERSIAGFTIVNPHGGSA